MRYFFLLLLFPLFSFSQKCIIKSIDIKGNKQTRKIIIIRELPFKQNDTLDFADFKTNLDKGRENILNTSLFNFVEIDTVRADSVFFEITINVTERWYLWPIPIFEQASRNFNTWLYERDFEKVNYGLFFAKVNFRGRNELLRFVLRRGFREQYGFSYINPGVGMKQKVGYELKFLMYRQKKVAVLNISNKPFEIYTNSYNYFNSNTSFRITYRPKIHNWHEISVSYNDHYVTDTVLSVNGNFIGNNSNYIRHFNVLYTFTRDKRNSNYYPLYGYYLSCTFTKTGLNIFKGEPSFIAINSKLSKYTKITERLFHSLLCHGDYSTNKEQSYIFTKALGYSNYVRGMELYLIDGNGFGLFNTSLKYQVIKPKFKHIRKIKSEKFAKFHYSLYMGINCDIGYAFNQTEAYLPHSEEFLYGYGLGIDFVTYYDIVMRFDLSRNKFNENGLFLHFKVPF